MLQRPSLRKGHHAASYVWQPWIGNVNVVGGWQVEGVGGQCRGEPCDSFLNEPATVLLYIVRFTDIIFISSKQAKKERQKERKQERKKDGKNKKRHFVLAASRLRLTICYPSNSHIGLEQGKLIESN